MDTTRASYFAVSHLLPYLLGSWRLARYVTSVGGTAIATASGIATWRISSFPEWASSISSSSVRFVEYEEGGEVVAAVAGGEIVSPFTQGYTYRIGSEGHRADVYFRDGRFFHTVDLSFGRCSIEHACAPDKYAGEILALSPTTMRLIWRVSGPHKDHIITTELTKAHNDTSN